ncbi:MAG: NosD domain-containing protein [Candidatus Thermoplasmatota archaeon]|nr:NosD domain-containing protein [Candidatus Thermoplasmatota archaeon]
MKWIKPVLMTCIILTSTLFIGCIEEENLDENTLYVDSKGTKDYTSIQEAINDAMENQTIFVYEGIYYEHIVINKSINLKGQNKENTIIDGNYSGNIILIEKDCTVNITGFTFQRSGTGTNNAGIQIKSDNNLIKGNIFYMNANGIYTSYANYNRFENNIFDSNTKYGMYIYTSSNHVQTIGNIFIDNYCGLRVKGSNNNNITRNIFQDNKEGMYFCCGARTNTVYHNTFINNSIWNADDQVTGNTWDKGPTLGGNYWDDYTDVDANGDGFGDTPYNITKTGDKRDNYPLIEPIVSL